MSDEADRRARLRERLEREATGTEPSTRVPGRTTLVEQHYGVRTPLNTGVPGKATLVDQHSPGIDVQFLVAQARQALAGSGDRDGAYKALVDALAGHAGALAPEQTAELMEACIELLQSRRSPTAVASRGVAGAGSTLPFYDQIQSSFGRHDVSRVRAQVGGEASGAAAELGARAYTTGDRVAFAGTPDLHTAAHEAAHVIQQRGGVQLKAIDGGASDTHEQHADAVADAVVAGQSAEALLDPFAGKGGGATVQRKTDPSTGGAALKPSTWEYCNTHRVHVVAAIADRIRSVGLPKPHPRLYWALRETAEQAFIDVLRKDVEPLQAKTLHRLMELSYPADLYTLVDGVRQGGTPAQLSEWHAVVGVAIANAMSEPLDASIQRMAMRLRVQLDGPAHGDVQKAHLVPSCPLDVLVAEALTHPGVIGGAERKATVDDTPGKPFARSADPVQFTYAGKRDPKLWNWIEVTSPKSATIEDVASTQLDKTKEDSVMGPEQAYRITASPPLFGIPIEVARRVPEMLDYASATDEADARAGNFGRVADVKALHDSSVSDDVATKQAPPAAPHTPGLDRLLGRVEVQLAAIATRLERVKAASLITGAQQFVARRREDLSTKPKEAAKYVPAVAAQEGVLHEVSSELVDIFNALDQRKAKTVPPSIADVIRAYARAAGASHLAVEATHLVADARRQKALLPLAIVDDEVRSARDAIGDHGDTNEKGADEQIHALPDMLTQAADLRLRVTRGEKVSASEVSQANADANELATRARLTNLASTVRALHDKAASVGLDAGKAPGGSWSVSMITNMILDLIYEDEKPHSQFEGAAKLHGGWLRRLELAKKNGAKPGHDPGAETQAAVKYINGELSLMDSQLGSMKTFITWCTEQIAYQELKNLLTSLAWQMGLMIVTGEIAGAGLAAVRGVALAGEIAEDVRGASLLWRGAEVVVHAGLQTIANGASGGGDISGSAFAENALGMLLTSAAMRPFKALMASDAALEVTVEKELSTLGKAGKLVKGAAKVGAEAAVDLGAGVVGSGVAHAIVNNADMGITSRDAWMTQGLALTASAVVHSQTQHLHTRIAKAAETMRLAKMDSVATQLDALAARAEKLQAKSAAKKGITPDEAGSMLTERHEILVQEDALYRQAGQGQLEKASAADMKAGSGLAEVQLQLAGLSSVVDGLSYEGTGKQIEHALKALGDTAKATRDDTGVWTVTADGRELTVKELDFNPKNRAPESVPRTTASIQTEHPGLRQDGAFPPETMFGSQQRNAAATALARMSASDYKQFGTVVQGAHDPTAQAFLYKAAAAGNSIGDIKWLAGEIAGKDPAWIVDNLTLGDPRATGGGLKQQWSHSCNAAMTITVRGNYDPVFALRMRVRNTAVGDVHSADPTKMNMHQADLEKELLESDYQGDHPKGAKPHKGVAKPRDEAGVGRFADDLLNAQVVATGMHFTSLANPSVHDAAAVLESALQQGMQVPIVVGSAYVGDQAHYVLAQNRRVANGQVEYSVHDPWTGQSIWIAASEVAAGRMFGFDRIGTIEVPSAVASKPADAGVDEAHQTPAKTPPGAKDLDPKLAAKADELIHTPRERALHELLEEARSANVAILSDKNAEDFLDWAARRDGVKPEAYQAVTLGDTILVRPEYVENVRVLREELIHAFQQRDSISNADVFEKEVEARLLMVRYRHKWGLTNDEVREMIREVRTMRQRGRY